MDAQRRLQLCGAHARAGFWQHLWAHAGAGFLSQKPGSGLLVALQGTAGAGHEDVQSVRQTQLVEVGKGLSSVRGSPCWNRVRV